MMGYAYDGGLQCVKKLNLWVDTNRTNAWTTKILVKDIQQI